MLLSGCVGGTSEKLVSRGRPAHVEATWTERILLPRHVRTFKPLRVRRKCHCGTVELAEVGPT